MKNFKSNVLKVNRGNLSGVRQFLFSYFEPFQFQLTKYFRQENIFKAYFKPFGGGGGGCIRMLLFVDLIYTPGLYHFIFIGIFCTYKEICTWADYFVLH